MRSIANCYKPKYSLLFGLWSELPTFKRSNPPLLSPTLPRPGFGPRSCLKVLPTEPPIIKISHPTSIFKSVPFPLYRFRSNPTLRTLVFSSEPSSEGAPPHQSSYCDGVTGAKPFVSLPFSTFRFFFFCHTSTQSRLRAFWRSQFQCPGGERG